MVPYAAQECVASARPRAIANATHSAFGFAEGTEDGAFTMVALRHCATAKCVSVVLSLDAGG